MSVIASTRSLTVGLAVAAVALSAGVAPANALNVGTQASPVGTGAMPFSASAGASRIVVNGAVPLNCTTTASTGTINAGAYALLPATIGSLQLIMSNCVGPSGFVYTHSCVAASAVGISGGSGATWTGSVMGIDCTRTFTALGCSGRISGDVPISYTNPSGATAGVMTVLTSGQSLSVSGSTCPPAVLPNGPAQFGAPVGAGTGLANINFVIGGAASGHPFLS